MYEISLHPSNAKDKSKKIITALTNFLSFYKRYEQIIQRINAEKIENIITTYMQKNLCCIGGAYVEEIAQKLSTYIKGGYDATKRY